MAALKWDEQAQAYVEPQNVPMRYDVESGAWVETTGMAWDEESQAWTERWNTGVSAYVYGAASETVTIKKDGIIVATVETGSNGQSTEHITLSSGTYTLTGSVSGWTEEQTVDKDTTKFRAMPEGALYWYGNECTWITGGWNPNVVRKESGGSFSYKKYANYIYTKVTCATSLPHQAGYATANVILTNGYNKINAKLKQSVSGTETYMAFHFGLLKSKTPVTGAGANTAFDDSYSNNSIKGPDDFNETVTANIAELRTTDWVAYAHGRNNSTSNLTMYAVWLEK